ncbi:trigger factor [Candidatus Atribacteria bacterium RBG_19FT_COMBO_35_14]|uniref:Trigger factor n=1 Tax=Candidatus Sediminicultor quintus TaxID=1797291 RepID=A0A1F5AA45_9BACT|nr:MAG: trigger factor [Candidatus Atribacteria bacterium RBG_19FT_COMBO_35_14]
MVKVEIEKQNENEVKLKIETDKLEVNSNLDKVYNEVSYQIKIPGFRKGRVPKNILNLHLGKEYFYDKTADKLIPECYLEVINKNNIQTINQPEIKVIQIEEDKPLIFEAIVQVRPEVKLGSFDKISIQKEDVKVTNTDVNNEIRRIQENLAKLKIVKDRQAKEGDFLVVDTIGYIEGKIVEGSKAEKQIIQLGKNIPPEFNKELIDCSAGDEKEIKILISKDIKDEKIAGKEITYKVKIIEIKEKELPELNADFVKTVGDYENLDDFREGIKGKLSKQMEMVNKNNYEHELLEKVTDICETKVPKILIERELEYMMKSLEDDLKSKDLSLQDYYESIKTDEEKVKKEYEIAAEKRIKQELVLDKISQVENIQVSEKEVMDKIETIAKELKQDALKVEATFKKNNNLDGLKESIKREKIIDFLDKKVNLQKEATSK